MKSIKLIQLKQEILREYKLDCTLCSPDNVEKFLKENFGDMDREYIFVIGLDAKGRPTFINIAHIGILSTAITHPREIFKPAILNNSFSIIIAHNHVTGIITPSKEDINFTKKLNKISKLIGIELTDHLIISKDKLFSFRKEGYL